MPALNGTSKRQEMSKCLLNSQWFFDPIKRIIDLLKLALLNKFVRIWVNLFYLFFQKSQICVNFGRTESLSETF